jgi:hypothetical protein
MSFGDAESPPTYYFSGITFNPSFYTSDYITKETGKKYFLSYPIAQGTETISTLIASTINSSASNDTVNLFNNITTGTLNLGNTTGTTANLMGNIVIGNDTNNSTSANNGTCQINKLRIGTGPVMRNVRFGTVAGGSTTNVVTFSPAFPSGQIPYIIGNIQSSNSSQVFGLTFSSVGVTSFRYTKTFVGTPFVLGGASGESFDWIAFSN